MLLFTKSPLSYLHVQSKKKITLTNKITYQLFLVQASYL